MKVNNVRSRGHEPETCSFNFHRLNVCRSRYCVLTFEESGLLIGFTVQVTCKGSSVWMLTEQGRFRPCEDLAQILVNRVGQELSGSSVMLLRDGHIYGSERY